MVCAQVQKMEAESTHKLFPPNAWMKVLHFNILTSCPKDELHQCFLRLYGEYITSHRPPLHKGFCTGTTKAARALSCPYPQCWQNGGLPWAGATLSLHLTLLFRTSMLLDRSRPLNSAVLTDQARNLAGAVMFTRSTPGCGTLAGPSLESAGFRSQNLKGYADSPGLKRPGALQKPRRPGSVPRVLLASI
jgi:hypothetical protein